MGWTRYDLWLRTMQVLASALIVASVAIIVADRVYGRDAIPSLVMDVFIVFGIVAVISQFVLEGLFISGGIDTPIENMWRDLLTIVFASVAFVVFVFAV